MVCLHLIRHGQVSIRADTYHALRPKGHEQALHLAKNRPRPDFLILGRMGRHAESRSSLCTRVRKALAEVVANRDKALTAYVVASGGSIAAIVQDTLALSEDATRGIEKSLVTCGAPTIPLRRGLSQLIS